MGSCPHNKLTGCPPAKAQGDVCCSVGEARRWRGDRAQDHVTEGLGAGLRLRSDPSPTVGPLRTRPAWRLRTGLCFLRTSGRANPSCDRGLSPRHLRRKWTARWRSPVFVSCVLCFPPCSSVPSFLVTDPQGPGRPTPHGAPLPGPPSVCLLNAWMAEPHLPFLDHLKHRVPFGLLVLATPGSAERPRRVTVTDRPTAHRWAAVARCVLSPSTCWSHPQALNACAACFFKTNEAAPVCL